jgi:hypothetical protein
MFMAFHSTVRRKQMLIAGALTLLLIGLVTTFVLG